MKYFSIFNRLLFFIVFFIFSTTINCQVLNSHYFKNKKISQKSYMIYTSVFPTAFHIATIGLDYRFQKNFTSGISYSKTIGKVQDFQYVQNNIDIDFNAKVESWQANFSWYFDGKIKNSGWLASASFFYSKFNFNLKNISSSSNTDGANSCFYMIGDMLNNKTTVTIYGIGTGIFGGYHWQWDNGINLSLKGGAIYYHLVSSNASISGEKYSLLELQKAIGNSGNIEAKIKNMVLPYAIMEIGLLF